jgi:hypothetical protein
MTSCWFMISTYKQLTVEHGCHLLQQSPLLLLSAIIYLGCQQKFICTQIWHISIVSYSWSIVQPSNWRDAAQPWDVLTCSAGQQLVCCVLSCVVAAVGEWKDSSSAVCCAHSSHIHVSCLLPCCGEAVRRYQVFFLFGAEWPCRNISYAHDCVCEWSDVWYVRIGMVELTERAGGVLLQD